MTETKRQRSEDTTNSAGVLEESPRQRTWGIPRHTGAPAFVALLCGATYLWVSSLKLDSFEQRALGYEDLQRAIVQHVGVSAVSIALVVVIAIPLGILLTRRFARWLIPFALGLANVGQATPKIGLLVLLALIFGVGFKIAVITLVAATVLIVLRNTIVGLTEVDSALIEAAEGMGMSRLGVLLRVELPLALPIIAAGVRTGLVLVVSYATIAVFVNAGGLGEMIVTGVDLQRASVLVTGTALAISLALLADWIGGIIEELMTPRGL